MSEIKREYAVNKKLASFQIKKNCKIANGKYTKITFTGDVMCKASTLKKAQKYDRNFFEVAFKKISKSFQKSDLVISNLETPIAGLDVGFSNIPYSFNAPLNFAMALKQSGIDLVTTANNHCLDRNLAGLIQTCKNLEKINLPYVGTRQEKEPSYYIKEINGFKIGFVSFTYGTNAHVNNVKLEKEEEYYVDLFQNQENTDPIINFLTKNNMIILLKILRKLNLFQLRKDIHERMYPSRDKMKKLENALKYCRNDGADLVFACLHFGEQNKPIPSDNSKKIARKAIRFGADAIIGNHEHVIQAFQIFKGKPIFYCHGNFYHDGEIKLLNDNGCSILSHFYIDNQTKEIKEISFSVCKIKNTEKMTSVIPFTNFDNKNRMLKEEFNKAVSIVLNTNLNELPIKEEIFIKFESL